MTLRGLWAGLILTLTTFVGALVAAVSTTLRPRSDAGGMKHADRRTVSVYCTEHKLPDPPTLPSDLL